MKRVHPEEINYEKIVGQRLCLRKRRRTLQKRAHAAILTIAFSFFNPPLNPKSKGKEKENESVIIVYQRWL